MPDLNDQTTLRNDLVLLQLAANRKPSGRKKGQGDVDPERPLVSHELIVKLIGSTTTATGLRVKAALDTNRYDSGIKVSDDELNAVKIMRVRVPWRVELFNPPQFADWLGYPCARP